MSRYVELAVDSVVSYLSSNLATNLRAVETEASIAANSLTDPVAYLKYQSDSDNRHPLIKVWEEGMIPENDEGGQRGGVWVVPCVIELTHASDADLEGAAVFVRRYIDAIMRTLFASSADSTLGGVVIQTRFASAEASTAIGDESATRHTYTISFEVFLAS